MTTNDGGPAFPRNRSGGYPPHKGMSLRDWFAGQALAGMLAYPGDERHGSFHNNCSVEGCASEAYMYADAMLKQRDRTDNN